jgi:hypothetical protein
MRCIQYAPEEHASLRDGPLSQASHVLLQAFGKDISLDSIEFRDLTRMLEEGFVAPVGEQSISDRLCRGRDLEIGRRRLGVPSSALK